MHEREKIQQKIVLLKKAVVDLEVEKQKIEQRCAIQSQDSASFTFLSFEGILSRSHFMLYSIPVLALLGLGIFLLNHPVVRYPSIFLILLSIWSLCALTAQRLCDIKKHSSSELRF